MRVAAGLYFWAACGIALWGPMTPCRADMPDVAAAVEALDHDDFFTRERATRQLREIGAAAIPALLEAANSDSLEVTCRAIQVLRDLSGEPDFSIADAVAEALSSLAESPASSAARRATAALAYYAEARAEHALDELRRLGAELVDSDPVAGPIKPRLQLGKAWQGGHEGLVHLKWVKIQQLSLRGVDVGDEALPHLRALTQMRLLELYGTRITPEGLAALQSALPNARIDRRAGGLLGIGGPQRQARCEITRVQEGSAAEQAGLREGDVITSFDGQQVGDFESLTELIAQRAGGDRVAVEFVRDGQKQQVDVVLGQWE